jgi:ATP-dependent Clp endopeptidase proteolytic subunit ClpP
MTHVHQARRCYNLYRNGSFYGTVLCAGAPGKRSALPHSRVMIHQPSGGAQGVATDMEINLREMLKLKDELYKSLSTQDKLLIKSTKIASVIIG